MERTKFARVDTLVAALSCPICFEMVKDCVVTPCGHSFCRACAGDAVTRKHCCPVCQLGVIGGEAGLIRNFLVDEVTNTLKRATEETDVAYMRLLFDKATDTHDGGAVATGIGSGRDTDRHVRFSDAPSPKAFLPTPPDWDGCDAAPDISSRREAMQQQQQQRKQQKQKQTQHAISTAQPEPTPQRQDQQQQGESSSLFSRPPFARLDLSPVEAVFINRMREAFLGYQSYYAHERAAHDAEIRGLTEKLLAAKRNNRSAMTVSGAERSGATTTVAALEDALKESEARFKAGMAALLRDFDAHAASAAPPPSLLPSTVTVVLVTRSVRFDTQLLPTHFPENVYNKVREYYLASGNEVRGFGPNTRLYLQPLSSTSMAGVGDAVPAASAQGQTAGRQQAQTHPICDATKTVFSQSPGGRVGAGWALVVDGKVLLASEEIKPCFAVEFALLKQQQQQQQGGTGGKDERSQHHHQRVNYFSCGECKLNWLCAACAAHCHGGCRDVRPFMLNHLPTWACCYCSKKRARLGCKLSAAGGKAEGANS